MELVLEVYSTCIHSVLLRARSDLGCLLRLFFISVSPGFVCRCLRRAIPFASCMSVEFVDIVQVCNR
jgi:hypothetical protein